MEINSKNGASPLPSHAFAKLLPVRELLLVSLDLLTNCPPFFQWVRQLAVPLSLREARS